MGPIRRSSARGESPQDANIQHDSRRIDAMSTAALQNPMHLAHRGRLPPADDGSQCWKAPEPNQWPSRPSNHTVIPPHPQSLTPQPPLCDRPVTLAAASRLLGITVTGLVKRARRLGFGREVDGPAGKRWSITLGEFAALCRAGKPPVGNPQWQVAGQCADSDAGPAHHTPA